MFAEITAIRGEKQHRAVQGSQLSFDHTDNKVDLVLAGDLGQSVNIWSRHVHCAVPVSPKVLTPLRCSLSQGGAKRRAPGIRRNKRFGKNNQLRAIVGRFTCQFGNPFQGAVAIERTRAGLNDGSTDGIHFVVAGCVMANCTGLAGGHFAGDYRNATNIEVGGHHWVCRSGRNLYAIHSHLQSSTFTTDSCGLYSSDFVGHDLGQ